nr:RapA guanosine triphosphatase-activating protein [Ipomoea batatas]
MKLVWSPETASKAYIDTVKRARGGQNPGDAEFLAAMAAGYNVKLIVEVRRSLNACGGGIGTSVGLAVAAGHTGGRHVCVVADETARREYISAMQEADVALPEIVVVGEAERVVEGLEAVDFLVVQGRSGGGEIFRRAKLSRRGAVLVYKGGSKTATAAASSRFCWGGTVDGSNLRIVKSVSLPLENGLEIAYVGVNDGKTLKSPKRWIRRIDLQSGEEHVFRR